MHMVGNGGNTRLLEEQMCRMDSDTDRDKVGDDRADACIWAMYYLAGRPSVDWEKVYGFGTCKTCGGNINFLTEKTCGGCGQPVAPDKQEALAIGSGEKSATRWWNAYVNKCPKGHENYPKKFISCPKCKTSPDEYLHQAMALSPVQDKAHWGIVEKTGFPGGGSYVHCRDYSGSLRHCCTTLLQLRLWLWLHEVRQLRLLQLLRESRYSWCGCAKGKLCLPGTGEGDSAVH